MFTINKVIVSIAISSIGILLSGCAQDYQPANQLTSFSPAPIVKQQSVESNTTQTKQPTAPLSGSATYQYYKAPAEARFPYPPIPDEPETPSKESQ